MESGEVLYLSKSDVEVAGVSMSQIIATLEKMFFEKGHGKVEMPPKPGIHTQPDAFIHAMPAYIPSLGSAGMKWVSGYPQNQAKGLPYIAGLLILNDPETGFPIAVMDCTWITAMRTGAASALAAKYLARPDSARRASSPAVTKAAPTWKRSAACSPSSRRLSTTLSPRWPTALPIKCGHN